jgi:hypothetical protein
LLQHVGCQQRPLPGFGDGRIGLPRGGFQLPEFAVLLSQSRMAAT